MTVSQMLRQATAVEETIKLLNFPGFQLYFSQDIDYGMAFLVSLKNIETKNAVSKKFFYGIDSEEGIISYVRNVVNILFEEYTHKYVDELAATNEILKTFYQTKLL